MANSLPYQVVSHDTLRQGLPSLKEDAMLKHPVELIQQESKKQVHYACTLHLALNVHAIMAHALLLSPSLSCAGQRLPDPDAHQPLWQRCASKDVHRVPNTRSLPALAWPALLKARAGVIDRWASVLMQYMHVHVYYVSDLLRTCKYLVPVCRHLPSLTNACILCMH
eukprot:1155415-Pelagomonas_calceolata.AAC.2